MTGREELAVQKWVELAGVAQGERESAMTQRYRELATLPDEELQVQMLAMANAEYDLPDQEIREFTVSRLRAWLQLELDTARRLATSYDAAMDVLPGAKAMRRVSIEQTLARAFSPEDQALLIELEPNIFGAVAFAARLTRVDRNVRQAPQEEETKRRWWPFGKR